MHQQEKPAITITNNGNRKSNGSITEANSHTHKQKQGEEQGKSNASITPANNQKKAQEQCIDNRCE
jgi:hypothetical protein